MPAFNDARCPKCQRKLGWTGELKDCPPCPTCGHQIPPESWDDTEKEMEAARKKLLEIPDDDD